MEGQTFDLKGRAFDGDAPGSVAAPRDCAVTRPRGHISAAPKSSPLMSLILRKHGLRVTIRPSEAERIERACRCRCSWRFGFYSGAVSIFCSTLLRSMANRPAGVFRDSVAPARTCAALPWGGAWPAEQIEALRAALRGDKLVLIHDMLPHPLVPPHGRMYLPYRKAGDVSKFRRRSSR